MIVQANEQTEPVKRKHNWYYVQFEQTGYSYLGYYKYGTWYVLDKSERKYTDADFFKIYEDVSVPEEVSAVLHYRNTISALEKEVASLKDELIKSKSSFDAKLIHILPEFGVTVNMESQKGKRNFDDNMYYVGEITADFTLPVDTVVIDKYCHLRHNISKKFTNP